MPPILGVPTRATTNPRLQQRKLVVLRHGHDVLNLHQQIPALLRLFAERLRQHHRQQIRALGSQRAPNHRRVRAGGARGEYVVLSQHLRAGSALTVPSATRARSPSPSALRVHRSALDVVEALYKLEGVTRARVPLFGLAVERHDQTTCGLQKAAGGWNDTRVFVVFFLINIFFVFFFLSNGWGER